MLLSLPQFKTYCDQIAAQPSGLVGIDFETTGVNARRDSRAMLIAVSTRELGNFSYLLTNTSGEKDALEILCSNNNIKYCGHNIVFEMHFLKEQYNVEIQGHAWCTMVMARVLKNDYIDGYRLQNCAVRIGETKYPPMLDWLEKRGNKGQHAKAPHDILIPYCEQDAYLSLLLAEQQIETFRMWDKSGNRISPLIILEMKTTKNLFKIERTGIRVDVDYCRRALIYERAQAEQAKSTFYELTGETFIDSRVLFQKIFDKHGLAYLKTEKGNASFNDESLQLTKDHPISRAILSYRTANKRASSYWENFIFEQCKGVMYPSIRQNGAATGRMSITNPAAQTFPNDSDHLYPIRRAIIPHPGHKLVSIDYAAMELRLIVDEANDTKMIRAINEGIDFHQKVADQANVTRDIGKAVRFARLYGAGHHKVAKMLGITEDKARAIGKAIDETAPEVAKYTRGLISFAGRAPYGYNWLGRRFYFGGHPYLYANYRIQSSGAEILRIAVDNIYKEFPGISIIALIHDEILFSMPEADFHLLPRIKELMIQAYPGKNLKMDASVSVGDNFHDMESRTI